MRLAGLIVIGASIAAAATELLVFRMVSPPDGPSALLGGLWVAAPYLATAALAFLARRRQAVLVTLLVALILAAGFGLPLLGSMAVNQADAEQQVRTAVQPGEDPNQGAAAMRKTGAEVGQDITDLFSVLLAVFLPPIQLAVIAVPALVAWVVVAVRERPVRGGELAA